jgi:DHA3 family macrolide efflux protein-like MFS transporter
LRTFFIVWITQSFSAFGSQLTIFAITVWLTLVRYPLLQDKHELAFALSALFIAYGVPAVFGAPIAGAWADRHDRKRTMIAANLSSGILSLTLMVLLVMQALQLWMLLAFVASAAHLGSFHWSSFNTSYAMVVPQNQLAREWDYADD